MKKLISFMLMSSLFFFAEAQDKKQFIPPPGDYHVHKGFHFEFGLGPAFGTIDDRINTNTGSGTIEFSGTGVAIDFKIGGALQENLFLTFDILSKAISAPTARVNGASYPTSNTSSLGEVTYGGGLTYYMMPSDIFFSGTIGSGTFVSTESNGYMSSSVRSEYGFSFQVKVGKHWWISNKWGISLSGAYGSTSAGNSGVDQTYGSFTEDLSSDRFVIAAAIGLR